MTSSFSNSGGGRVSSCPPPAGAHGYNISGIYLLLGTGPQGRSNAPNGGGHKNLARASCARMAALPGNFPVRGSTANQNIIYCQS